MTEHTPHCPLQSEQHAQLLLSYCARSLDPARTAILQRHIAVCPECHSFLESQQLVWDALDDWNRTPVSPNFDASLYQRIRDENQPEWAGRAAHWYAAIAWKPALPAAAIFALWLIAYPAPPDPPLPQETVAAEQMERTLEDLDMLQQLHLDVR